MGTAKLWYYPSGARAVTEIDLGERLTDLQERPEVEAVDAVSLDGRRWRTILRSVHRVRVVYERFSSSSTERKLRGLIEHLTSGGMVGVAEDSDKAWAAFMRSVPAAGRTTHPTFGSPFWNRSAALAAADEVWVQSPPPESEREMLAVSSVSGSTIFTSTGTTRGYELGPVLIRHRGFYPVLRLPDDQLGRSLLSSTRRIGWTLDVELVEDTAALWSLASLGSGSLAGSTAGPAPTLAEHVRKVTGDLQADFSMDRQPAIKRRV